MPQVIAKPLATHLDAHLVFPSYSRLTQSQIDVCQSINRAFAVLPWARPGRDLAVVVSPFQISDEEIASAIQGCRRVLSVHMEDPYALSTNLDRVRNISATGAETWVCTNDASTLPHYQAIVGGRVIVCPTLGPDDQLAVETGERDIDVLICGYAYPSRKRFMTELLPLLDGLRVVLVGDGWEGFGVEHMPTQPLAETYKMHTRARTVVCMHRIHGDCSDGAVAPANVNRGAMEGAFGARVFIDQSRPMHDFDPQDVVWYDAPADLAVKIRNYLSVDFGDVASRFAEKCRRNYTYRSRLARVLNCVRTPRFLAEIP